eukprot:gene3464-3735_t
MPVGTADQQYSPQAHWAAIKQLVDLLPPDLPVIGNGDDIFEAADALQMVRETGCHGGPRAGRTGSKMKLEPGQIRGLQAQKIALPHGWLDDPDGEVPEDVLSDMDTAACEG